MIVCYGASLVGTSHKAKGTVCQDAHKYLQLKNGWMVAAVADGVGSSKYSDKASQMAVETVINFFKTQKRLIWCTEIVNKFLPEAYAKAQKEIEEYAINNGHEISDYDTTLDVVIYNGQEIFYGHAGDGGIVGLTKEGDYISITKPQKGNDGFSVIPLRGGSQYWQFAGSQHNFTSVLMATDGIYDTFFPYLLKGQEIEVYIPLIRFFMDNQVLQTTVQNIKEVEKTRIAFLESTACESITDDKTVLVMIHTKIMPKLKDESFYAEPDWATLQIAWNRKAYPHLYKKIQKEKDYQNPEES